MSRTIADIDLFVKKAKALGAKVEKQFGQIMETAVDPAANAYSKRLANALLATGKGSLESGKVVVKATENMVKPLNPKFEAWASEASGGCGLGSCRCSPGLWISASQGNRMATAHFGTGFERGNDASWTGADYLAWRELMRRVGL